MRRQYEGRAGVTLFPSSHQVPRIGTTDLTGRDGYFTPSKKVSRKFADLTESGEYMSVAGVEEVFSEARRMIHRGEFGRLAHHTEALAVLEREAGLEDVGKRTCLQASVMLAELYDQMSRYSEAERFLQFDPRAAKALRLLKMLTESALQDPSKLSEEDRTEPRLLLRALAFFCLQHAIAWHRETQDGPNSLKGAIRLARAARSYLVNLTETGLRFDGALSMFSYWLGRFHLLARDWDEARKSFQSSMQHEQENLLFHLRQHALGKHEGLFEAGAACRKCASRIDYTNYLLASNMAFGLAIIELEEGAIENALILLRAALIMFEGSTQDDYRKGYVRLLIGKAERIRTGADAIGMGRAVRLLKEATDLLTCHDSEISHVYYAARAYHQLCLAYIFMARDPLISEEEKENHLLRACRFYLSARTLHDRELSANDSKRFVDRSLQVRLDLTRGRLLRELLKVASVEQHISFYQNLRKWSSSVSGVELISKTWADCSSAMGPLTTDRLTGRLAQELLDGIKSAIHLDAAISGEKERRPYLSIAEAEAIVVVAKYAAAYSRRIIGETAAAELVWLPVSRAKGFFQRSRIKPRQLQPEPAYVWREVALAYAVAEMKKLIGGGRRSIKVRAIAEVMLARLLLLQGDKIGARRQLREGWEPLKEIVENTILSNAVAEIRNELGAPETVCIVDLGTENNHPTWDEMVSRLHADIIRALREEGLKDEAIADRLKISKSALNNWSKH